jgi:hypothetical protein
MRATLSFAIPQEREEFESANKGAAYASAVHTFDKWLNQLDEVVESPAERQALERVRDKFRETLERHGLPRR